MEIFVRKNDTLGLYSQLFNIPLILIEKSNPDISDGMLSVGQRVRIPGYY